MVSIDTVYQRVMAFANKEQRGYITPQEFNLFADQAQKEILEQYFYDINQWNRGHGNTTEHSDMLLELNEKLAIFKVTVSSSNISSLFNTANQEVVLPETLYKIGTVSHTRFELSGGVGRVTFEELNYDEYQLKLSSPLTRPTLKRPYFINQNGRLKLLTAGALNATEVGLSFIRKPAKPYWAYVVVNGKTLYNDHVSINFELHASEESELVYRILAHAGISIEKPNVTQAASMGLTSQIQQEKQ